MRSRQQMSIHKRLLQQKNHPCVVRLLLEIQLENVATEWLQELTPILAKISRLGQYLVPCDLIELLGYGPLVIDPSDVGIHTEYQEVHE